MLIKKIYGLIGKDIDYSFSRNYFNSKFKKLQILENEYINFDLKNISDFKKINLSNIYGFNVTIPFKEEIYQLFTQRNYIVSAAANAVRAINTVYKKDGKIYGDNSDIYGFAQNLSTSSNQLGSKNMLLIGAGSC